MSFEIKDLAGLSQPLTKLIEVVSDGLGVLYRPRNIRFEADAKAYEIKTIERAKAEAEIDTQAAQLRARQDRILGIAKDNPELAERAKLRLLNREIEGQLNVEEIVERAIQVLPDAVSGDPISADWRRKFFLEAENVCEIDMQLMWGKVLAGEIAKPGSFSLRTLETLRQLSQSEAELFVRICGIAMEEGLVMLPDSDFNTALKRFGFQFGDILQLSDAGLLLYGNYAKTFPRNETEDQAKIHAEVLNNNGVFIELSGPLLISMQLPAIAFTQSGRELLPLIEKRPNEDYLTALGHSIRMRGVFAKRGTFVAQDAATSLLVFEQDL